METERFFNKEERCKTAFEKGAPYYHLCTPENHQVLFHLREDYRQCMSTIGLCIKLFPDISILTFQIMTNHIHLVLSGNKERIEGFFTELMKVLKKYYSKTGRQSYIEGMNPKIIPINDLENLRNVIAYVNRNGYVVLNSETPFSYEWGANRYYFGREAKQRYIQCRKSVKFRFKRIIASSRKFDDIKGLYMLDDYICPASFCGIEEGEAMFRDAHNYFFKISKNIEIYRDIASLIGEQLYYSDDDLFSVICKISAERYKVNSPSQLSKNDKLELAKRMHYDYNAGNKQIARMLKIDLSILSSMFA